MSEIHISYQAFFLVILASLSVGVTIGAVVAGLCAAANRGTCVCELHPAPVIEVENAFVMQESEPHFMSVNLKFHSDRRWLFRFKESDALSLAREINCISTQRVLQQQEKDRQSHTGGSQ
jgi:hypothetical protein